MSVKSIEFRITPEHPDFGQAKKETALSKIMGNGVNAIARNYYFWKQHSKDADLSISQEFGVDVTRPFIDQKTGEVFIDDKGKNTKDWFKYSKDFFAKAEIYSPVRLMQAPDLHSKIAQAKARQIADNWSSYWGLWREWKKDNTKQKPSIPNYQRSLFGNVPYTKGALSKKWLDKGVVKPHDWEQGFELPEWALNVQSANLVPVSNDVFELVVQYVESPQNLRTPKLKTSDKGIRAGVDVGAGNLFTVAFSDYRDGIIIDGKPLIAMAEHSNYVCGKFGSFYDYQRGGEARNKSIDVKFIKHVDSEVQKRSRAKAKARQVSYYTAATNKLVKEFCSVGVSSVVIGWSEDFKKNSQMSRVNNRKFIGVPHREAVDDLVMKCEAAGIEVVIVEESYTSKASFMDNDLLPVFDKGNRGSYKFSGYRRSRGEYKSKLTGRSINADLNGAYNILRKAFSDYEFDEQACMMMSGSVVPRVNRVNINY